MRTLFAFLLGSWVGCSLGWALYPRLAPEFARRLRSARAMRVQHGATRG